jgi:uncharacterized protein (TIGR02145 family)
LAANTSWYADTSTGSIGNDLSKNNSTGFSALPGGYGDFGTVASGYNGGWWSSTEYIGDAYYRGMYYSNSNLLRDYSNKGYGYSVRCIRDILSLPTLTTTAVSSIETNIATCGGNIMNDGGSTITVRGVCWSTSTIPTIADSKTTNGNGTGTFISAITGLTANTTYNIRAYATNSVGTAYGTQVSFTTTASSENMITDRDGNVYHTLTIGTQTWMAENLKTTQYNDGTAIPLVTDNTAWGNLTTSGYCWYNNDTATYKNTYGALYNWYTVNTGKLAPKGWHVPTDVEWTTLQNYLTANGFNYDGSTSGDYYAKSLAAATNWVADSGKGTIGNDLSKNNRTGFSALPGGGRFINYGTFINVGGCGYWWSSTEGDTSYAWYRYMNYDGSSVYRGDGSGQNGFSVRCVRDSQ